MQSQPDQCHACNLEAIERPITLFRTCSTKTSTTIISNMKLFLALIVLTFGFAHAAVRADPPQLRDGRGEGNIGTVSEIKIDFNEKPFSLSVRPASNPFESLRRMKGRILTGGTTTPAAEYEDSPPTCDTIVDCEHLHNYTGVPDGTSFDCYDGWIYSYPQSKVCAVVCTDDTYCEELGSSVGWPPGTTCHKRNASISGVCSFPGTQDFTTNNLCKDPTRFNASVMLGETSCGHIATVCNNVREFGGLADTYITHVAEQYVPACCGVASGTGSDHYNPASGCGDLPAEMDTGTMMCGADPDNKFMPDTMVEGECKSQSESGEGCHTPRCKTEQAYCESQRGQLIEPGNTEDLRRYPNDLTYIPKTCEAVLAHCRSVNHGAFCQYTKSDGSVDRCIDRACSQDKAECLSREGVSVSHDRSDVYRNMTWVEPGEGNSISTAHELAYFTKTSMTCCSKGQENPYFTPSCHPPAAKQHVLDNLGCEKGKFKFGKVHPSSSAHTCVDVMSGCSTMAARKGSCRTPGGQACHDAECLASKEGCHAKRGKNGFGEDLEFAPFTFFDAVQFMGSYIPTLSSCCDGELQLEKCKPHPDVPVFTLDMCKSDTFQPANELPTGSCLSTREGSEGVASACHDMECTTDPAYCESRSGQPTGVSNQVYGPNMTFTRYTCGSLEPGMRHVHLWRGDCGEWSGGAFYQKCHEGKCKHKSGCEAEGLAFKPYTQEHVDGTNAGYAHHYLKSDDVGSWGTWCCGGRENLRAMDYPYTIEPLSIPEGYIMEDGESSCKKCECCGDGTTCKDGRCYPTVAGAIKACKLARGKDWEFTCDGKAQCARNVNTRRLQRKPEQPLRWSQGRRVSMPAAPGSVRTNHHQVPWNQGRPAAPRHRLSAWNRPTAWNRPPVWNRRHA